MKNTLLILPCCAKKEPGGQCANYVGFSALEQEFPSEIIAILQAGRRKLHDSVQAKMEKEKEKKKKKTVCSDGPDFGGENTDVSYLPAIQRYRKGTLYSAGADLIETVTQSVALPLGPRILIISALYGVLHPLESIQDYELQMDGMVKNHWLEYLPEFFAEYFKRHEIRRLELYLGTSTQYYKLCQKMFQPFLDAGTLEEVVQYHIKGGRTSRTPSLHGKLLLQRLGKDMGDLREDYQERALKKDGK